ncbi:hypothetical protein FH972_015314 [Carpinus fangiana]|uniref:Dirigent protein n=1 Tax=Carpinus fangiana TaxID=176857 RepID=A0A5N6RFT4_9ROSI|nr:hypothetical protein FH972_015314 [Carpinus fangiana]
MTVKPRYFCGKSLLLKLFQPLLSFSTKNDSNMKAKYLDLHHHLYNFNTKLSLSPKAMSNPLSPSSNFFLIFTLTILFVAYTFPRLQPKQTNLVFYVHNYLTGNDTSAITVASQRGPTSSILHFGTMIAVDDPVTVGPSIESKEIGRAQGMYVNSQLDGKGLHMVFSVIFTDGEFKGSSLEIQGADIFAMKEREFGIVSGTGYFRFVKGYGIMETEFMDIANLRAVLKLNETVKHF